MQARPNPGVVVFLALIAGLIGGLGGAFVYGIYLAPPDDGGTQTPPPRTDTVQIKTETDAIVEGRGRGSHPGRGAQD